MAIRLRAGAIPVFSPSRRRAFSCRPLVAIAGALAACGSGSSSAGHDSNEHVLDDVGRRVALDRAAERSVRRTTSRRLSRTLALVLPLLAALPSLVTAQRPAELVGRVMDPSGAPIEAASLELVETGGRALTDVAGRYRFRAVSEGRYTLRVARLGYLASVVSVTVEGGSSEEVEVTLAPSAVALEGVAVTVAGGAAGGIRVGREEIGRSGARSAGDVLQGLPGVVVRSTAAGGAQTASVRGAAPDAVLVLVDGVVLNDPVTGEADLSTVPAEAIESLVLLAGGQSARYGPRAEAGVILIETRLNTVERSLRASAASLGSRSANVVWGSTWPLGWSGGAEWSVLDGVFDFDLPSEVGGGERRRENADARTLGGWLGIVHDVGGGVLRIRGSTERTRRGLPGRGYAPSRRARQSLDRQQATAGWQRQGERGGVQLSLASARHRLHFRDDEPPFGLPYDDTARVTSVDVRGGGEQRSPSGRGLAYGGGVEVRWQAIEATVLDHNAPVGRTDAGVFGHAGYGVRIAGGLVSLSGQLRVDRDKRLGRTTSRSLTLGSTTSSGFHAHLALRSSYSPPTLSDQYFRSAIGVEPNPELDAERVPLEIDAELRGERTLGAVRGGLGVAAYRSDVNGMIVWTPDFRFVWSPRNVDVKRVGVESRASLTTTDGRLRLGATYSYTRIVYDRAPPEDDVQVIYRPRHTANAQLAWQMGRWRTDVEARYTGARFPVAAPVNALPSFWTASAALSRGWRLGGWTLTPTLRGDRLFNERASLIFGFPEPGRTLALEISLKPSLLLSTITGPR